MSRLSKIVLTNKNFQQLSNLSKIVKNFKLLKIVENCQKHVKNCKNCQNVGQVMFPHHSDQMSQRSGKGSPIHTESENERKTIKQLLLSKKMTYQ